MVRRNGDSDPSDQPARQTAAAQFGPRDATVGRTVEPAVGAAAVDAPGESPILPHAGEHDARVVRIPGEVRSTGVSGDVERLRPRLAAVGRPVNAAIFGV